MAIQNLLNSNLSTLTGQAWQWWKSELLSFMPSSSNSKTKSAAQYQLTCLENSYELNTIKNDTSIWRQDNLPQDWQIATSSRVDLKINESQVLFKTIKLPLSTEENIDQVLNYEIDRFTPFNKESIYFQIINKKTNKASNVLEIELCIIKRAFIDPIVQLTKRNEAYIGNVFIKRDDHKDVLFNIEKHELHVGEVSKRSKSNAFLFYIIVLLTIAVIIIPFVKTHVYMNHLNQEISLLSDQVRKVKDLQAGFSATIQGEEWIMQKAAHLPAVIEILNELTYVISDESYLDGLSLYSEELRIRGKSTSASKLLTALDKSDLVTDVQFAAPVTQSSTEELERFEIQMNIMTTQSLEDVYE